MYIPSHTRFTKNKSNNTFEKRYILDNNIYHITVTYSEWDKHLHKKIVRWFSTGKEHTTRPFPYGTLELERGITPQMIKDNACEKCGKCLKTFKNKIIHMETCKISKELIIKDDISSETNHRETTPVSNINNVYIQNNIQIRDLGKENPKWLTKQLLHQVVNNISKAIPTLMEKKHFNDDFPENKNLRLLSSRDINKRLQVYSDGRWRLKDSKQTFYKVLVDIYDILSDALSDEIDEDDEDIPSEIREIHKSQRFVNKIRLIRPIWKQFQDKIDDSDVSIMSEYWEDLKTLLLDRQLGIEQGFD
jgi:hypothetical protein